MKRNRIIVISLDSLIAEDFEYLKTKPTFRMLCEGGSIVRQIRSIYPCSTYPCHTTMATGCYPDKHGITNNNYITYQKVQPWIFEHENVKCEDILDVCKRAGLKTAAVGWPVTGNHKSVDYLVNECWPRADAPIEEYEAEYVKNGTPRWLYDEVVAPFIGLRYGRKQPESSYFLTNISAEMIKRYKPDILMLHQGNVDKYRHDTGVFSDKVRRGLDECEEMVKMIVDATREAGVFDETNFIVTADHGQLYTVRNVNLNWLFRENGLIKTDFLGNIVSADAWCQPSGMSAQIHLKNKADKALYDRVYSLLKQKRDEGVWGFSEVYERDEFKKMHLDGDFSFVIETDGYSSFAEGWCEDYLEILPTVKTGGIEGDHGHHPDKGPRPSFLAFGPDIKRGAVIEEGRLIDGAPTYAKILGVELPYADGEAFTEILRR